MKQRAKDGGYVSPNRPFLANSKNVLCIFDFQILVLQLVIDAGGALHAFPISTLGDVHHE
jgi:hypothetical protein